MFLLFWSWSHQIPLSLSVFCQISCAVLTCSGLFGFGLFLLAVVVGVKYDDDDDDDDDVVMEVAVVDDDACCFFCRFCCCSGCCFGCCCCCCFFLLFLFLHLFLLPLLLY